MGIAGAYRLGPEAGRLLVHTSRTGLGAKAGHDLTIEVTRWHGHATVDTADPANSVTVQVDVDSFEVRQGTGGVKPLTDADRALIKKTLGEQVLHTAQHPTITFRSRRVDGSAGSFTLDGELTIMGITRPVTVQGGVTDGRVVGRATVVPEPMGNPALLGILWRPQAQGRGQGRLRRGPHPRRLTALGRVLAPIFKLCFRSSAPFVGVCELGASGAIGRLKPP